MSLKERSKYERYQRKQTFLSKLYRQLSIILFIGFITFGILSILDSNTDNLKKEIITTIMLFGAACFFTVLNNNNYMLDDEDMEI